MIFYVYEQGFPENKRIATSPESARRIFEEFLQSHPHDSAQDEGLRDALEGVLSGDVGCSTWTWWREA